MKKNQIDVYVFFSSLYSKDFNLEVFRIFVEMHNFASMSLVDSLRYESLYYLLYSFIRLFLCDSTYQGPWY